MNRYLHESSTDAAALRRLVVAAYAAAFAIPVALLLLPTPAAAQVMGDDACPRFAVDHAGFATCDGDRAARSAPGAATPMEVTPRAALALKQARQALFIDVRAPARVAATGTPFGVDYVVSVADPRAGDDVADRFVAHVAALVRANGGDQDTPLVLICADGTLSARAMHALRSEGYPRAVSVAGGIDGNARAPGWIKSGLPLVTADRSRLLGEYE